MYDSDDENHQVENRSPVERSHRSSNPKFSNRINTPVIHTPNHSPQRRTLNNGGHDSRASKRDLGEILETLER